MSERHIRGSQTSISTRVAFRNRVERAAPIVAVGAAIATSIYMLSVASERELTGLELTLFQVISLGLGLWGSYVFGRQSALDAASELMKPYARSAFRRVLSLYTALGRFCGSIEERRALLKQLASMHSGQQIPLDQVIAALDLLFVQINEQIGTADDAMEDWRDIVPDEVAELERRATERQRKQDRGI
jgi:hypothetical protein